MFRFSLQKVLDLRARVEQTAATELAQARSRLEEATVRRAAIQDALQGGIARLTTAGPVPQSVGELRSRSYVLAQLDARLQRAEHGIAQARAEEEQREQAFTTAFRDRRVIDRLREKHLEAWREETGRADLAAMDGIALTRFALRTAAPDGTDGEETP